MDARHTPASELPPLPALVGPREAPTAWPGPSLTREHIRRPQVPQGPIDDAPTPLQGGQEGRLVLGHQVGYLGRGQGGTGAGPAPGGAALHRSLVGPSLPIPIPIQYLG